ncbi:short/branched chain specific acyl-CoA dehydrogenase [Apiospora phragmitis]|uniref:Short/branched chain specific acyl-CoA dehydrogenase n=1 Tax=Apiospora phragmitis TaxID=2905665 RepID=A0ABR1TST5_9PEZI
MKHSHLFLSYAYLLSCAQARQASDWSYYTEDICPWGPFHLPFSMSCLASDPPKSVALQSKLGYNKIATAENSWSGPHFCLGRFCVWSNDRFGDGGVSVVTTLSSRHRVAQVSDQSLDGNHDTSHFRAVAIPGKGIGLVATRLIRRGEEIMAVRPAVVVHEALVDELGLDSQNTMLDQAAKALPGERRQRLLAQAGELGGYRIADIMFTNSFQVSLGMEGERHFGNFPEVSRLNHDCRPSLAYYVDQNLTHHTHAVRDIQPGEELSISYLDSFRVRSVRQARTRASWGFSCGCSQCSLPEAEAEASDARLFSIYQVENQLTDLKNANVSTSTIETLIALYKEERLDHKIADAYTLAALNYNTFGVEAMAKEYAKLSLEQGLLEHGHDSEDMEAMRILAADPKSHWIWDTRQQ